MEAPGVGCVTDSPGGGQCWNNVQNKEEPNESIYCINLQVLFVLNAAVLSRKTLVKAE